MPIVFDVYEISYEEDVSMVSQYLDEALLSGASFVQLDLLNDISNPWKFVLEEAPKEPEDLIQLKDLTNLTEKYPTLITMNIASQEVFAFLSSFPVVAGVFFRLQNDDVSSVVDLVSTTQRIVTNSRKFSMGERENGV